MTNQEAINCLKDDFDCHACKYHKTDKCHEKEAYDMAISALESQINSGWIKCSDRLPKIPEPNSIFENKPLELYLVTVRNADYSFRAFWNGKAFTDGWSKLDVSAWQPLPEPYKESEEE